MTVYDELQTNRSMCLAVDCLNFMLTIFGLSWYVTDNNHRRPQRPENMLKNCFGGDNSRNEGSLCECGSNAVNSAGLH